MFNNDPQISLLDLGPVIETIVEELPEDEVPDFEEDDDYCQDCDDTGRGGDGDMCESCHGARRFDLIRRFSLV